MNEIWSTEWTLSQDTVNTSASVNHVSKPIRSCKKKSRDWSVRIPLSELCELVRVRRIWGVYDVCEGSSGSSSSNSGVWWMTLYPHTLHWLVNELQAPIVVLEVYVISGHMHYTPALDENHAVLFRIWRCESIACTIRRSRH